MGDDPALKQHSESQPSLEQTVPVDLAAIGHDAPLPLDLRSSGDLYPSMWS
jgi:hypothetical protein